ncbi:MAG: sulfite exporter TauE/SafE family protein [Clostridiaceae bacterium]
MQGFFLGLANGTVCVAYCAPVLVPYMLGTGENTLENFSALAKFLFGRLLGYMAFALLAWGTNKFILENTIYKELILGLAYAILAVFMFFYGTINSHAFCSVKYAKKLLSKLIFVNSKVLPVILGLFTGLNLCPPFLIAFTEAAVSGSISGSVSFFLMFFIATSLYFLPIPFIGMLKHHSELKKIGKMAAVIMSLYYLYMGITIIQWGAMNL